MLENMKITRLRQGRDRTQESVGHVDNTTIRPRDNDQTALRRAELIW